MSDMKCPMCNTNLEVLVGGANAVLGCPRCRYKASDGVWQELIRTRKALDVANEKLRHCVNITVEELDELKRDLLIAWNALLHFSKDPIANNALKKITAPEQRSKE